MDHAIHTDRKADGGGCSSTNQCREPVVAPTATKCALLPLHSREEVLPCGATVVVQPAHQTRGIDHLHASNVKARANDVGMRGACITEVTGECRCALRSPHCRGVP